MTPRLFTFALLLALLSVSAVHGEGSVPDPAEILQSVRMTQFRDDITLQGRLRCEEVTVPFTLTAASRRVEYRFEKPPLTLRLELGDDTASLVEVSGGAERRVTPARYDDRIAGTDVTFEDLSLRFLYWPHPLLKGSELVLTRKTWHLELPAPPGGSQYCGVQIWVDQQSGALLQMEGYDPQGRFVKRFKVVSGQTIDGAWTLKQMRIESFEPGTRKVTSRTYLEIEGK